MSDTQELTPTTPPAGEVANTDGLVGEILELETQAGQFAAEAKRLNDEAKAKREQLKSAILARGLKTITAQNGAKVTVQRRTKMTIKDQAAFFESIKKNNMAPLFLEDSAEWSETVTHPAETKLREDSFQAWWKTAAPNQQAMFEGIEITPNDTLSITAPKGDQE